MSSGRDEDNSEKPRENGTSSSVESLSQHERKDFKNYLPQITASAISGLLFLTAGISYSYPALIFLQLQKNSSDIQITQNEAVWIGFAVTIYIITKSVVGLFSGFIIDKLGRLNTIKLSVVFTLVGWIIIASSKYGTMIIIGRIIATVAVVLGTCPAIIYITEIASPNIRGSLLCFGPLLTSVGFFLPYIIKSVMNWRAFSGVIIVYTLLSFLLVMFIPESPAWLISKGRNDQAKKALKWFHKYQPNANFAHLQFEALVKDQENTSSQRGLFSDLKKFLKPTGYKPLLLVFGLLVFRQFSILYVNNFSKHWVFQSAGCTENTIVAKWFISGVHIAMAAANILIWKIFCRRSLIIYGSAIMTLCTFVSGLGLFLIEKGFVVPCWITVTALILYETTSVISFLPILWIMVAELFPIEIRSVAYGLVYSAATFSTYWIFLFPLFTSEIENYNLASIHWFFTIMSLASLVYGYLLIPETQGVKLSHIQNYFEVGTIRWARIKKIKKEEENKKQSDEIEMGSV